MMRSSFPSFVPLSFALWSVSAAAAPAAASPRPAVPNPAPAAPSRSAAASAAPAAQPGPDGPPREASPSEPRFPELTIQGAMAIALRQNRDIIAAKLDITAAELDRVAAGLYWNPVFSYSANNLVLPDANTQEGAASPHQGFFSQVQHTFAISEVIDVWAKRSARIHAADAELKYRRLAVEDALREILYDVSSAFVDVVREQSERDLSRETRARYAETVRLSRARFSAGEISDAELRKIELEGLKYENAVIDAELEFDLAREKLASLLGIGTDLPYSPAFPVPHEFPVSIPKLTQEAFEHRPDLLATRAAARAAEAELGSARREAFPDISVGVSYTHSNFTVSGDNPNVLGLSASLPLPLFDRNQAGIGRAELEIRRANNDEKRIELEVRREVAEAARRVERAQALLSVYEKGGMLDRADTALRVAEKSYRAGAISLLELLEARRTYIETRGDYLRVQHEFRQAIIDLYHSVGGSPK